MKNSENSENSQLETFNEAHVDEAKVQELREKFDRDRQMIETKKYDIELNTEETQYLMYNFYEDVEWKGYESYAISETYSKLEEITNTNEESQEIYIKGSLPPEIIEAVFHFLKNFTSRGPNAARIFKSICDQFAISMRQINEDRQHLRDLSLEIMAAEQGIPVEDLVQSLNQREGR